MPEELTLPSLKKADPLPEEPLFETFFEGDFTDGQEALKLSTGKCRQFLPVVENEITKEVHEYVCPDGKAGWQAFLTETVDGKKMTKSFGEGPEAESRSFGWTEVKETEL
jgi:hypothetical protein